MTYEKGWYWVITKQNKILAIRYFSGRSWKYHPSELESLRDPARVIERIKEPKILPEASA